MEAQNSQNTNEFDKLLEKVNQHLFNQELADITEVTYAYADIWDGKVINKTLFWTFLWKAYKWEEKEEEKVFWKNVGENIQAIYGETLVKLVFKRQQLQKYRQELLSIWTENNSRLQLLLWSLDYLDTILDLTLTWLPFEAEKAGLNHKISQKEAERRVKQLEEIEKKLFWWNVRKNKYEVRGSYNTLIELFEEKKETLTPEEQQRFLSYLQILKGKFSFLSTDSKIWEKKAEKSEIPDILNQEILRESYVKIFEIIFEIYWINKEIKIEERSSIYDGEDYLGIPESDAYKTLKIQRILELIQHEVETHYIIEKNNSQTLGKFRGRDNLQREEWLAMIVEWFLNWKNLEDIEVSWSIPDLLMWEILSGKEYKDFLEMCAKLKGTKDASGLFLRRKRNYPLNYPWVQHKDTSYNRGQHKIVEFVKKWGNIKDLYVWKVSFDDIEKTKKIIDAENIKLMYPLLIWELLQYIVLWKSLKENEFWQYIEGKYLFLNIRQEIVNKTIERLTFSMKRKVVEILSLLE